MVHLAHDCPQGGRLTWTVVASVEAAAALDEVASEEAAAGAMAGAALAEAVTAEAEAATAEAATVEAVVRATTAGNKAISVVTV